MRTALTFLAFLWVGPACFAQTATLRVVEENGPRSNQVNIVYLSEGYTTASMPAFAGDVANSINYLFSREPWKQYRKYCNVYRIEVASAQNGTDNGSGGGLRNTYFHSGFNQPQVEQLLYLSGSGQDRVYSLLNTHVPEYDMPVVLVNDAKYGGAGGPLSVSSTHPSSRGIVEHEIGHSFAGLVDEYDFDYPYNTIEAPNNTANTQRSKIRWKHWIEANTPLPTPEISANASVVGIFEGSMYKTSGWYRPHYNSLMKTLFRPPGEVNREEFVRTIYRKVTPIDSSLPAGTIPLVVGPKDLSFSVTPKETLSGPPLEISWKLDGTLLEGQSGANLEIISDLLGNGSHTVTAEVRDPSTFVRSDPSALLTDRKTWSISLTNQLPADLAGWRNRFGPDDSNPAGDGLENLIKYALGLDPDVKVVAGEHVAALFSDLPVPGETYLTLTVPRRTRRSDVDYVVEVCGDLSDWGSGPGHTVTLADSDNLLVVRDTVPRSAGEQRFIRLKVVEK